MAAAPNVTIEQWRALIAVVDAGGYAQAAAALHKSQSSITYAVQKLESLLGVQAFEVKGRRAELTPTGQLLYRRARALVDEAVEIERAAQRMSAGWEAEIRVAVEVLFPTWMLLEALARFSLESPHTHIEVYETVIEGARELLRERQVDLALTPHMPEGLAGETLLNFRFVLAASPSHPLHGLGRELTLKDLRKHRHLVVRDTAKRRPSKIGSIDVAQRWTVSNMATSIEAACAGFGFAWYPEEHIRSELERGLLKPLPLREGGERRADLYLAFAERDAAGPGTLRLAELLREQVRHECNKRELHELEPAPAAPAGVASSARKPPKAPAAPRKRSDARSPATRRSARDD